MYEQPLHMQHNSSTSGFNATRVLLTQYYQSWWLGHEIIRTAQQNTVGHKKGFPKRPFIFLHPKTEKARQSANLTGVDSHKSVGLR